MPNAIEKKFKTAEFLRYTMIVVIPLTLLFWIFGVILDINSLIACGMMFFFIAVPTSIAYIEYFHQLHKSVKYLYKLGLQDVANDIKTTEFNLPVSNIYMGKRAFFAKKPATIIPYTMVVWVYIQTIKYMGVIPIDEKVIVCCRDGKSFEIRANRNELPILLRMVNLFSPDLIVGYGANQIKQYDLIIKNKAKKININKLINETGDENTMICKNCGNEFEKEFGLCPNCGTPIEDKNTDEAPRQPVKNDETAFRSDVKYCVSCGAAVKADAKFCAKCGSNLDDPGAPVHSSNADFGAPVASPYAGGMISMPAKKKLKWWQIMLIAIAGLLGLCTVLGVIGAIISNDTSRFYGNWTATYDYSDVLNEALKSSDEETASFVNIEDFTFDFKFEFNDDNTYKLYIDEASIDESYNKFCEEYKKGFKKYLNSILDDRDINVSVDEFISMTGIDLDEKIAEVLDKEKFKEGFKDFGGNGNFKADNGKLFLSDSKEHLVDEEVYEEYFFEDDNMFTLLDSSELTDDTLEEHIYPLTFVKE